MADAAHAVLIRDSASCTGNFFIDELVLREEGVSDFSDYAHDPSAPLAADFFVPDVIFDQVPTKILRAPGY